jgi:hypothetical protein
MYRRKNLNIRVPSKMNAKKQAKGLFSVPAGTTYQGSYLLVA